MLEKTLETKFVKYIQGIGGKAVKGPAYQYKGIPDRIGILPNGGGTVWVEFKNGKYKLQPIQEHWRDIIINSSPDRYFVVDSEEALENCITKCNNFIRSDLYETSTQKTGLSD